MLEVWGRFFISTTEKYKLNLLTLWKAAHDGLWGHYSHLPRSVKEFLVWEFFFFFFKLPSLLPRFYTINWTTSHGSMKHNTNKVTVLLMSKQLQSALACLSWTQGSHQCTDEQVPFPTGHLSARAQPQAFMRGGGKLYHQINFRVIIFFPCHKYASGCHGEPTGYGFLLNKQ